MLSPQPTVVRLGADGMRRESIYDAGRAIFLSVSVLLFLFAGLYKADVPSPVDLTVVAAAMTCVGIAVYWRSLADIVQPVTLVLAALLAWTGIRLFPGFAPDGVQQFAESILFGIPAFAAGFIINRHALRPFLLCLAWSALPATIYLALTWNSGFNSIGDSYQLTGMYLASAMVAAASLRNWFLLIVAGAGILICGNLSGVLFGAAGVAAVWLAQRQYRPLLISCAAGCAAVLLMGGLYASGNAPNLVNRFVAKINYTLLYDAEAVTQAATATEKKEGKVPIWQRDRFGLFQIGLIRFSERPLLGHGTGSANYVYSAYPHNFLIELAAETGIVGVGLGVALIVVATYFAARNPFAIGYFVMICLTFMVSGPWGTRLLMFGFGLAAQKRSSELATASRRTEGSRFARLHRETNNSASRLA